MAERVTEVLKRPGHRLIRLQGGDSLKVPTALFRLFPITVGDMLDVAAYRKECQASEPRLALEQAARYLEARDRSTGEILDKLNFAGFSRDASEAACAALTRAGYLNDQRFARASAARLEKKYGAIRIRQELRRRGLSQQLVDETLADADEELHLQAAVETAKKALRGKQGEYQALYRRAYGALARRGYPPGVARQALSLALGEAEEDESDT